MKPSSSYRWHVATLLLLSFSVWTSGCNLFGSVDTPTTPQDKYSAAVALANDGQCSDAVTLLNTIPSPSDDVAIALGWAELCVGGATAANIATSLYKFTSGSNDLTSVGVLARTMLPTSGDKTQALNLAVTAFNSVQDSSRRSLNAAIGSFAQAAGILANQAGINGTSSLVQLSIAPANCVSDTSSCATSANCTAGMSNADVRSFVSSISAAATSLQVSGASNLLALANALNTNLPSPATAQLLLADRCFIFNNTIPTP